MTTSNDIRKTLKLLVLRAARPAAGWGKRALAAAIAAQLLLASSAPAFAQRRKAEPEANPQFQESLQQPSGGSGSPLEPEASPASPPPSEEPGPGRNVQGVQIGTSQPRPAPAAYVAPLDARVTVRVKGAPLATFLDTISAQAKVNFIITEGLESKRVTAFLQNVTVREALQVLLEIKGLTYQQIGKSNTYVVTPRSKSVENLITRIYTLAFVPLIALGTTASEQAAITPTSNTGAGAAAGGGGAAPAGGAAASAGSTGGDGKNGAPPLSEVAIVNVLQSILSRSGKVSLEPRTNSLIVTDIPEVFPQVEQIIAELDKKAPQLMIEAQIVEIDSSRAKELGLEWGGPKGELASFTGGQRDTPFPLQLANDVNKLRFLDPLNPTGGILSTIGPKGSNNDSILAGSYLKTSVLDLTSLSVTLRALVSRSEARFLGKPKVLTLNNKAAIIQIASNQAVSVTLNQSNAGGGTSTQLIERIATGLILRVTPQVNKDGYITMLVQPSFTDVQESAISSAANRIFDATSRGASTLVRVKNGQTLVMGGLLQSTETKVVRKVPFLGYIPLIGWLFTSVSNSRRNADLVIFITPTIVND